MQSQGGIVCIEYTAGPRCESHVHLPIKLPIKLPIAHRPLALPLDIAH